MTSQTLYFPQTDAERKAFDHAIDRVLFHVASQIQSYNDLINDDRNESANMEFACCAFALNEFKNLLMNLFKSQVYIDD
jgi:hypothetical protein